MSRIAPEEAPAAGQSAAGAPATPAARPERILLVDDEEANVRLLTRILNRAGFTNVHGTTRSSEALARFGEIAPDLVVLDIRMPAPDGFQVLEQLRRVVAPTDFLPVLAITGDATPATRQRVLSAGAKDFLEKPFESAEVIVRVENLLTTRRLHRSLQDQNNLLEEKVRQRTAQLEAALAAAEAGSRSKSQFLAMISHELRTPLNAVIGFSNHLLKNKAGNLLPQDLALLQRIGQNGTHLLSLITEILDLSRIEAGKLTVERSPVALDQLVQSTIEQVQSAAAASNRRAHGRMAIRAGLQRIHTDEGKLRIILTNLVDNAAKFSDNGEFCVAVRADAAGRPLRVDVVDKGIGIPVERLEAIFHMFEQADNSTQRRFGGTGLGLAISRALCNLLGYRLTVVSTVGAGSAFSILLEADAAAPETYAELATPSDGDVSMCA